MSRHHHSFFLAFSGPALGKALFTASERNQQSGCSSVKSFGLHLPFTGPGLGGWLKLSRQGAAQILVLHKWLLVQAPEGARREGKHSCGHVLELQHGLWCQEAAAASPVGLSVGRSSGTDSGTSKLPVSSAHLVATGAACSPEWLRPPLHKTSKATLCQQETRVRVLQHSKRHLL